MNRTEAISREWTFLAPTVCKKALKEEFERVAVPEINHLYTVAFYLAKEKAEADDLVQETYLRAFRFFDKFKPGTNCRSWLLSILRKLFLNRCQQMKREPDGVDWEEINHLYEAMVEEGQKCAPESLLFSKHMDDEVEAALRDLPEEYRTAIVLVTVEELSYEQAARVMGCPLGTVRSRVSRASRMLQVTLRDYALKKMHQSIPGKKVKTEKKGGEKNARGHITFCRPDPNVDFVA